MERKSICVNGETVRLPEGGAFGPARTATPPSRVRQTVKGEEKLIGNKKKKRERLILIKKSPARTTHKKENRRLHSF